jgi:cysteine desulfurase
MDISSKVYLDYAATTPVDPRVLARMLPYFNEDFGNPSSVHFFGQKAEAALEKARETIARVL